MAERMFHKLQLVEQVVIVIIKIIYQWKIEMGKL